MGLTVVASFADVTNQSLGETVLREIQKKRLEGLMAQLVPVSGDLLIVMACV